MANNHSISTSVIKRLPRYYRFLGELLAENVIRISSRELSEKMNLTASQIRQDLNCFGGFGQQGYGYNIKELHAEIAKILGIDKTFKTILIGAGNLGKAVAMHMNFEKRGCKLIGIFDKKDKILNEDIANLKVQSVDYLDAFCKKNKPDIAILCIPKTEAQQVANHLVSCGVQAFWNYSHYDLRVEHSNVIVENVHLGDSLLTLTYRLNHK